MNKEDILIGVKKVLHEVLDNIPVEIILETKPADIPDWDSLTHIQIIAEIEEHFDLGFNSREIVSLKSVNDIVMLILSKNQTQ